MGAVKSTKLDVVLDSQGRECRGEEAKRAIRDAYAALGIEDMLDKNFDADFARVTRLRVRRMAAERIEQEELDKQFEINEVESVLKTLIAGKASGGDEVLVEWLKFGKKQMTYALWVLCNMVWVSEQCPEDWSKGVITLQGWRQARSTQLQRNHTSERGWQSLYAHGQQSLGPAL